MDLVAKIKEFFKGEITVAAADLEKYSRDASLFKIKPQLAVAPQNVEDIKNLVKFVSDHKSENSDLALTVRSGGTDMTGGALSESIVVDVSKHINRLKEVGDNYAVVEPGMFYRDFEKATLGKNLLLPSYPASREICTVGGMAANNSGGEKTLKYGKTIDYVAEIKAILRDGREYVFKPVSESELEAKKSQSDLEGDIYRQISDLAVNNYDILQKAKPRVSKNSSGYYLWDVYNSVKKTLDISKLIVGSQGTLGIVTEIKFNLVKPKKHRRLLVIFLKNGKLLAQIVQKILGFGPESFESYDDHTFKVALKFLPELAKKLKGGLVRLCFNFLHEFVLILFNGMPKMVLLAEFSGDTEEEIYNKARAAERSLEELKLSTKISIPGYDTEKYWVIRRESFNFLRQKIKNLRAAPFIDDIIVKPEHLPQFLPQLYEVLDDYAIIYTIAGHVGDGNFHIIPLMDLTDPKAKNLIVQISRRVYALVIKFGGSISAEHNDGLIRGPYLKQFFGPEIYRLFEEVKKVFDPAGIFNPGKKVGASLDYSLSHLDSSKKES
ncbi:MAG: FAD-binding oxidoreductase [Candidatus Sungbacteria bacterium]|uniref:D-lactate dehydrogenase (cytochrome) n=1 Tax=Candidatus Sungiibacteriota bacterium TaxID=2750080 RepID=A0A932DSF5_9BACT|nr:FAD-binding oxidoreductase [Candidatus Sungbacteria bacterium]MBI2465990.1 FAD-binding oxidoreductase [Candidatus Sungbacteria bacterium]